MSTPSFDEPDRQAQPAMSEEGQAQPQHAPAQYPPAGPGYPAAGGYQPVPGEGHPSVPPPSSAAPEQAAQPHHPEPTRIGVEAVVAAGMVVVIAVLGLGTGLLWSSVAPWVPAIRTPDGAVLAQPEQEQMIADEGWYLAIAILAGVLVAVLAWVLLRRYRGVLILLGLAVGGVAAGLIAYKLGHNIGHAHAKNLADHAPIGTAFSIPPNLRVQQVGLWHGWLPYAKGDLLTMPIASVVTYLLLAGFSPYPTLRPVPAGREAAEQPATDVSSGW